jgi:hypothetical protein
MSQLKSRYSQLSDVPEVLSASGSAGPGRPSVSLPPDMAKAIDAEGINGILFGRFGGVWLCVFAPRRAP